MRTKLHILFIFCPLIFAAYMISQKQIKTYVLDAPFQIYAGPSKKTYPEPQVPVRIILHSTANTNEIADACFHAEYLWKSKRKTSWHFTVDDKTIIQHYPINVTTWGAKGCNTGSIHIEVCQYKGMDLNKALTNLEALLNRLPALPVVSHHSCTGKNCPSIPELWSYINDVPSITQ